MKNPLRFAGDFFIKFHDDVINFTVGRIDKMDFKKIFSMITAAMILFTVSNGLAAEADETPPAEKTTLPQVIKKSVEDFISAAQGDYTGLIIDCRGLGLKTAMSPVIKNVNGTKIYGHKDLDIDKIIEMGMVDYVDNPENVARAGTNPLIVKAVSLDNFNSDPVVSIADSNKILIENRVTKFLKELRVVFLFD